MRQTLEDSLGVYHIYIDNEIHSNPIDSVTSSIGIGTTQQFFEQKITNRTMYKADLFYHRILANSGFFTTDY